MSLHPFAHRLARRVPVGVWHPGRIRAAVLALVVAAATAILLVLAGGPGSSSVGATVYVAAACLGTLAPAAITAQVVLGQLLVARLLIELGPGVVPVVAPAVCGIVATAELLAVVARLDAPLARDAGAATRGVVTSALAGGALFAGVALAGTWSGPAGPVAVGLAAGGCLLLALRLVRVSEGRRYPLSRPGGAAP